MVKRRTSDEPKQGVRWEVRPEPKPAKATVLAHKHRHIQDYTWLSMACCCSFAFIGVSGFYYTTVSIFK